MAAGFKIDLAHAPQLVKDLEEYVKRMQETANKIQPIATMTGSAGHDDYSAMIAGEYNRATEEHLRQNKAAQKWAQGMIDSINAAIQSYKHTDENNHMKG